MDLHETMFMQRPTTRKMNIVLSSKDYETLVELTEQNGISLSELVREVLRVGVWYQKEIVGQQRKLFIRDKKGGPMREFEIR